MGQEKFPATDRMPLRASCGMSRFGKVAPAMTPAVNLSR
jgi:hypothetical protein